MELETKIKKMWLVWKKQATEPYLVIKDKHGNHVYIKAMVEKTKEWKKFHEAMKH
jgi:hypothetical protein